ncbi:MAG: AMP-binding protein, partial [Bacteroidetes bacterium]|nr:AMP-binding protein [Bacteroidota bacterium]
MATAFCAILSRFSRAPRNPSYQVSEFDFHLSDLNATAVIVQVGIDSPVRDVATRLGVFVLELHSDSSCSGLFSLSHEDETLEKHDPPEFTGRLDEALVLHTSGTTSRPKMVPLSHENLVVSAVNISESLALSDRDVCMNVMPLFHIHGLMASVLASFQAGAGVVCTPGFSARSFLEQLSITGATWYSAVPTMHQAIVGRAQANPSSTHKINLRFIRSSSASLAPSVMHDLEDVFGVPVIESYGMTEASHQMTSNPLPPLERKPGSVGLAAGPDVSIMIDGGVVVGPNQVGEIVIRGKNVTAGYSKNPEANALAFTNGWFHTGDQGYLDNDGYLKITGRLKEIINRGGEKISPR